MENNSPITVFISYSHYDERWLNRLLIHLKPLSRDYKIDTWSDKRIQTGSKWKQEIAKSIEKCDIAILLISPDFLASDFINTNELPPLILAAEEDGKLILPIIISPSLFVKKEQLSQFQAINDASNPVIGMNEFNQENTFLKVAETILDRSIRIREKEHQITDDSLIEDNFLDTRQWTSLIKFGNWLHDENNKKIIGSGTNAYLLSHHEYGRTAFEINAKILYSNFDQFGNKLDFINTGIIFGWETEKKSPTYYNILFTGKRIVLERVGMKAIEFAGQTIKPYEHLVDDTDFDLKENKIYQLKILFNSDNITLFCDNNKIKKFKAPNFISGRVGLRAWRCQVDISEFKVKEILNSTT